MMPCLFCDVVCCSASGAREARDAATEKAAGTARAAHW